VIFRCIAWVFKRKYLNCRPCGTKRALLSERADNAHLEGGEIKEEKLGSVDYEVYVCPLCSSVAIDRVGKWFSGYSKCKECRYKTLKVTTRTLSAATRSSTGRARVTKDCKHCSYNHSYTKVIPRLPDPSTSSSSSTSGWSSSGGSSSGGSSFGGGSSGGGGASSSW